MKNKLKTLCWVLKEIGLDFVAQLYLSFAIHRQTLAHGRNCSKIHVSFSSHFFSETHQVSPSLCLSMQMMLKEQLGNYTAGKLNDNECSR